MSEPSERGKGRILLPVAAMIIGGLLAWRHLSVQGPPRIDEVHRLAESSFFHLLLERDFANPAWFRHIVDRTNPVLPKYLFGAAIVTSGERLPTSTSPRVELADGELDQGFAPGADREYGGALAAMRRASLICTALSLFVVSFAATRLFGIAAGIASALLYPMQFLVATYAAAAIADPLLTMLTAMTLLPLIGLGKEKLPSLRLAAVTVALGLICGAALATRASGLLAWGAASVWLFALALKRRDGRLALLPVPVLLLAFCFNTAVNPYYWSTPVRNPDVADQFTAAESLPQRIATRYLLQQRDLQHLLARENERHEQLRNIPAKLSFAAQMLLGDAAGLLAFLGVLPAILIPTRRRLTAEQQHALLWAASLIAAFLIWVPLPWPRYVLIIVPPFILVSAAGWGALMELLLARLRKASAAVAP